MERSGRAAMTIPVALLEKLGKGWCNIANIQEKFCRKSINVTLK
jgi:hypothetical protein